MPGQTPQMARSTTFSQRASSPSWDWFSTSCRPPLARPHTPPWAPAWALALSHACTSVEVQDYTVPLGHPALRSELYHSTPMDPGRVCTSDKGILSEFKIVWYLFEAAASRGADLPRLFCATGDGSVLLHGLLGHPRDHLVIGQCFFVENPPADLSRPLWALGGGGVARGVGFALLLHLCSAFHHIVLLCARLIWLMLDNTLGPAGDLHVVFLLFCPTLWLVLSSEKGGWGYNSKISIVKVFTCRSHPHDGRSPSQVARGKFSPEMEQCVNYSMIV